MPARVGSFESDAVRKGQIEAGRDRAARLQALRRSPRMLGIAARAWRRRRSRRRRAPRASFACAGAPGSRLHRVAHRAARRRRTGSQRRSGRTRPFAADDRRPSISAPSSARSAPGPCSSAGVIASVAWAKSTGSATARLQEAAGAIVQHRDEQHGEERRRQHHRRRGPNSAEAPLGGIAALHRRLRHRRARRSQPVEAGGRRSLIGFAIPFHDASARRC